MTTPSLVPSSRQEQQPQGHLSATFGLCRRYRRQYVSGMRRRGLGGLPHHRHSEAFSALLEKTKVITSRQFINIVDPHLMG